MKNTKVELKDIELEAVSGGVSWQFFGEEPVKGEAVTPNPYIFSDYQASSFVPI